MKREEIKYVSWPQINCIKGSEKDDYMNVIGSAIKMADKINKRHYNAQKNTNAKR